MRSLADLLVAGTMRGVTRGLFRLSVHGREHIPAKGPALLVSNHLTLLDGFLIGSCVGPVVRFLAWKPYYDNPLLNWGYRLAKAIPIAPVPTVAALAIRSARAALQNGEILCIFAEGSISRTGDLLPFQRGLEAMVRGLDVPIVPVRLHGLWDSVFSYRGGKFFWKMPRAMRHPVRIVFGASLPPTTRASQVRQSVAALE
jgi:acyl-[acyl-carrier-protein]-phospholipid O-acyltransferase/long-chain-fatty-acid--[acyl-carrier-protein] ligase